MDPLFSKTKNYCKFSKRECQKLNNFLKKYQLEFTERQLIDYFLTSIKMRENSKFVFTRALSDLIEILKKFGESYNLSARDLSKLTLSEILNLNSFNRSKYLKFMTRKDFQNEINKKIKLPYLITTKNDFFISSILQSKPNFITKKIIKGKLFEINEKDISKNIKNKIILIEKADPGFDWIFSKKIKALITKYGGVNSHMSIRCEELNVPAAIGIGEDNYNNIKDYSDLILNCKNEQLIKNN